MKEFTPFPRLCGTVLLSLLSSQPAHAVTFTPLGHLPSSTIGSGVFAISGDGKVVVGSSFSGNGLEAYRWTQETGMVGLGDLPGGRFESSARATSFDGSVVVGNSKIIDDEQRAFRWTEAEGMVMIGEPDQKRVITEAVDVSADGNTILVDVGRRSSNLARVGALFSVVEGRITDEILLPDPSLSWDGGRTDLLSADGQAVYGAGTVVPNDSPFRWTRATGSTLLPSRPTWFSGRTVVQDATPDEMVLVGTTGFNSSLAYRWTDGTGFERLLEIADSPGVQNDSAIAVSADGSVIVGWFSMEFEPFPEGFLAGIWDETVGWQSIQQILIDSGIDISDWKLLGAGDISDDGRMVVGTAINPDGNGEAWLADLSNPTLLPGDYNANNLVEQGDLDFVLMNWGTDATVPPDGWIRNLPTGLIDQAELDGVLLNWGRTQPPAGVIGSIPEPSSIVVVSSLVPLLYSFWRRDKCRQTTRQYLMP